MNAPVSKPKVASVLSLIAAALTLIVVPLLDGKPETIPQWEAFLAILTPSIGLWFSRDNGTTSEQAGAK